MSVAPAHPLHSHGRLSRAGADLTITAHLAAGTVRLCLRDRGEAPMGTLRLADVVLPDELRARLEEASAEWGARHPGGCAWVEVRA